MYLAIDVETTGLAKDYKADYSDTENWPRIVELAWQVLDSDLNLVKKKCNIIKPNNFIIPQDAIDIHGIDQQQAEEEGVELSGLLVELYDDIQNCQFIIGHNIAFDKRVLGCELFRANMLIELEQFKTLKKKCTMLSSMKLCDLKQNNSKRLKYPKLNETYVKLFDKKFEDAHMAEADLEATVECFRELKKRELIKL